MNPQQPNMWAPYPSNAGMTAPMNPFGQMPSGSDAMRGALAPPMMAGPWCNEAAGWLGAPTKVSPLPAGEFGMVSGAENAPGMMDGSDVGAAMGNRVVYMIPTSTGLPQGMGMPADMLGPAYTPVVGKDGLTYYVPSVANGAPGAAAPMPPVMVLAPTTSAPNVDMRGVSRVPMRSSASERRKGRAMHARSEMGCYSLGGGASQIPVAWADSTDDGQSAGDGRLGVVMPAWNSPANREPSSGDAGATGGFGGEGLLGASGVPGASASAGAEAGAKPGAARRPRAWVNHGGGWEELELDLPE